MADSDKNYVINEGGNARELTPGMAEDYSAFGASGLGDLKPVGEQQATAQYQKEKDIAITKDNPVGRALAGAGSGMTFGFSTPLLVHSMEALYPGTHAGHFTRHLLAGASETTPYKVGQLGGLAAGTLITGGLGDAAGITSLAAQGAAEGALMGAGSEIEKASLENKALAAEALLASMGEGAIFGGAIGGTLQGIGKLSGKVAGAGRDAIESALQRNVGAERASLKLMDRLGATKGTVERLGVYDGGVAGFAKEASNMLEEEGLKLSSNPAKIREVASRSVSEGEKLSGKILQEFDKAQVPVPKWESFTKAVESEVIATKGMMPGSVTQAENVSRWLDKMAPSGSSFKSWAEGREVIAKSAAHLGEDSQKILGLYDQELQNAMRGAENFSDGLKGAAGRFEAAQKSVQLGRGLEDLMTDRISTVRPLISSQDMSTAAAIALTGNPGSALSYGLGKAAYRGIANTVGPHLAESVWRMSAGLKAAGAVTSLKSSISKAARGFLRASVGTGTKASVGGITREKYDREVQQTYDLIARSRAQRLHDFISASKSLPIAEAMVQKSDRAIQNTQANIPAAAPDKKLGAPDKLRAVPLPAFLNDAEHKFLRTHGAIKNPMSVLSDMEKGRVSKESVQAIKQNWPETYNLIVDTIQTEVSQMKAQGKTLPMSKITQLSILLDKPLDTTLTPAFIQPIQEALQEAQPQNQAKPTNGPETSADTQEYQTPAEKVIQ